MPKIELLNIDCMEYMAGLPDKAFPLAIVDPPYGIGGDSLHSNRALKGAGKLKDRALNIGNTKWDIAPTKHYFNELKRVSENQIIWGANYFDMPKSRGVICWDKCQPWPNFSAWEMAWTSFNCVARIFKFDNRTTDKIHPTQKPIDLYKWLLINYATCKKCNNTGTIHECLGEKWMGLQEVDCEWCDIATCGAVKILDTHLGSGSSAIAAHQLGFDFVGCEIDKDYYDAACKRFKEQTAQTKMF